MITFEEAELRAKILKSLAHPVRLMIVDMLKDKEMSFSEISSKFDMDKSTISKHLSVLKQVGIVTSTKVKKDMIYKLEIPCVIEFFECSTKVLRQYINRHKSVMDQHNDFV
ncbi:hypothetical protein JCM12298_22000 [Desulfothermus naphthae]